MLAETMERRALRMTALEFAIKLATPDVPAKDIVAAAMVYEEYLSGSPKATLC